MNHILMISSTPPMLYNWYHIAKQVKSAEKEKGMIKQNCFSLSWRIIVRGSTYWKTFIDYLLKATLLATEACTLFGNMNILKWRIWCAMEDSKNNGPTRSFSNKNNTGFAINYKKKTLALNNTCYSFCNHIKILGLHSI